MQRISANEISAGIAGWRDQPGHLSENLTVALKRYLVVRNVKPGTYLPSERTLSGSLNVSRGTVVRAYSELEAEKLVTREVGIGTRIQGHLIPARLHSPHRWDWAESLMRVKSSDPWFHHIGTPFLDEKLAGLPLTPRELRKFGVPAHGMAPFGLEGLREMVARRTPFGHQHAPSDHVLVTAGVQPTLALISDLMLSPHSSVLVETPTYPGILEVVSNAGARPVPIPCDADGPVPSALKDLLERHRVAFIFLMPTGHQPTGRIMSLGRRHRILDICREHSTLIIEDLATAEVVFSTESVPPTLFELSKGENVISLGSFSKVIWSGLRVGWALSNAEMILKLSRQKLIREFGSGILEQIAVLKLVPQIEEIVQSRRTFAEQSAEVVLEYLQSQLPDWIFVRPRSGYSIWVRLPLGNGDDFTNVAINYGVIVEAGSNYALDNSFDDYIRLATGMPLPALLQSLDLLREAWSAYRSSLIQPR